ncbi:MAG: hypothetical protein ACUZ8N_02650 [Candidatus Scalindua sp.]
MVAYIIAIIFIVLLFAICIWLTIKQSAKEADRINKEMEKNRMETDPIEAESFLDNLHDSINIIRDYGAILQTRDEDEFLSISESSLPHSRKEIVDAIISVESFIETVLNDDSFRKSFIENHDYFRFDKTQAEYLLSEKYRESLKTGLAYLEGLVTDEKEITADNVTALKSEDFKKMIDGFLAAQKKSRK